MRCCCPPLCPWQHQSCSEMTTLPLQAHCCFCPFHRAARKEKSRPPLRSGCRGLGTSAAHRCHHLFDPLTCARGELRVREGSCGVGRCCCCCSWHHGWTIQALLLAFGLARFAAAAVTRPYRGRVSCLRRPALFFVLKANEQTILRGGLQSSECCFGKISNVDSLL